MNNLKQFIDSGVIKFAHQKQNRILTPELAKQVAVNNLEKFVGNGLKLDSADDVMQFSQGVYAQDLTSRETFIAEYLTQKLSDRSYFPMNFQVEQGATHVKNFAVKQNGVAEIRARGNVNDIPRVEVETSGSQAVLFDIFISYDYNTFDERASAMANFALTDMKLRAARKVLEERINQIFWVGSSEVNQTGYLNNANIPREASTSKWKTWADAGEGMKIINQIRDAITEIVDESGLNFEPDTLILPVEQYAILTRTYLSNTNPFTTIMEELKKQEPGLKIYRANEMKGEGARAFTFPDGSKGGFESSNCLLLFKSDPEISVNHIQTLYEGFAPFQKSAVEWTVLNHTALSAPVIRRQQAFKMIYNI